MKYVVTLNGNDYEVEVNELNEAVVTAVVPSAAPVVLAAPVAPVAAPVKAASKSMFVIVVHKLSAAATRPLLIVGFLIFQHLDTDIGLSAHTFGSIPMNSISKIQA